MPDDPLPLLQAFDPSGSASDVGVEAIVAAVGVIGVSLGLFVGKSGRQQLKDGLRGPYGLAFMSFYAGCLTYFLYIIVLGQDFTTWSQSFWTKSAKQALRTLAYIEDFVLVVGIIKSVCARRWHRPRLVLCVLACLAAAFVCLWCWTLGVAHALSADGSDGSSWIAVLTIIDILIGVPLLAGRIFSALNMFAEYNLNPTSASLGWDSAANTVIAVFVSLLVVVGFLTVVGVNRIALINLPGIPFPTISDVDGTSRTEKLFNLSLLNKVEAHYEDDALDHSFRFGYGPNRARTGWSSYDEDGNLYAKASDQYTDRSQRQQLCRQLRDEQLERQRQQHGDASLSNSSSMYVDLVKDGDLVQSTGLEPQDDGKDAWVERKYRPQSGQYFCYENWWSTTDEQEGFISHNAFETVDSADNHALAGKVYDEAGNVEYNILYSYDDQWSLTCYAYFDDAGDLQFLYRPDSEGNWGFVQASNWAEFSYTYPAGVSADEVRDMLASYFGGVVPASVVG